VDFNLPEELKMVQTLARDFVKDRLMPLERELLGRESDLTGARRILPQQKETELASIAREAGLWGLNVPESLGGAGLGILGACLVEEELAKSIIPFNPGDVSPVLFDCNEEQKRDYLAPVIEGKKSAYLALIEPGKGKDLAGLQMRAQKADGNYILNGKKLVFSNHNQADFAVVFAVTNPEKGIREGVSCFLVDTNAPGFTISSEEGENGWRAQLTSPIILTFDDCKQPPSKILGEEGKAFYLGKSWLPYRRIVRSARCVGAAVRLLDTSVTYAKYWQSQGQSIAGWPAVRTALANMAVDIQASRLLVYQAACKADEDQDIRLEAAMVKVHATEMLERVAGQAVLIRGGPAPSKELPLEVLCRSMLISHINESALEVQKAYIASNILSLGSIL
jgi:acyl-CoA dehydrogenase